MSHSNLIPEFEKKRPLSFRYLSLENHVLRVSRNFYHLLTKALLPYTDSNVFHAHILR